MTDDKTLLRRLHGGDPGALGEVYAAYRQDLLRIATCLLVDPSAAEDALHDSFVAFAADARRLAVRTDLRRYLAVSIANRARDGLRRRAVRDRREPSGLEAAAEVESPSPEPPLAAIREEESAALREALGALPYEQREAVTLHLHGDLPFREIAREQATSINTVMSRYRYGLARLRSLLNEESRHEVRR